MKINKNDYFQRYTELSVIIIQTPLPNLPPGGQEQEAFPPWGKRERGLKRLKINILIHDTIRIL
jgi:hypothetical protein